MGPPQPCRMRPAKPLCLYPGQDHGLRLLNVTGINNWTDQGGTTSETYNAISNQNIFRAGAEMQGVSYQYIIATNVDCPLDNTYINASQFPLGGRLELVVWQTYNTSKNAIPDNSFKQMATHPLVEASTSDNLTYLGYAISCAARTSVGQASIWAKTKTFSDFQPQEADIDFALTENLSRYPGVRRIHCLVYSAFTSITHSMLLPPRCDDTAVFPNCDGWAGANTATRGAPVFIKTGDGKTLQRRIQSPTITPERMVLAMQKLFGEVTVAAMSSGPGNWTLTNISEPERFLRGLDTIPTIIPGVIPYIYPLILLAIWVLMTVIPQLHPSIFLGRRWAGSLDGITLFRLGAEWTERVHRLHTGELLHLGGSSLKEIPGMIGDMNATGVDYSCGGGGEFGYKGADVDGKTSDDETDVGFAGLSTRPASTAKGRYYTMRRSRVMDDV